MAHPNGQSKTGVWYAVFKREKDKTGEYYRVSDNEVVEASVFERTIAKYVSRDKRIVLTVRTTTGLVLVLKAKVVI